MGRRIEGELKIVWTVAMVFAVKWRDGYPAAFLRKIALFEKNL
jgi:hypothetical protein